MFELVIFDLDGTLLYTLEDLRDSVNYALSHFGFPNISLMRASANIGNGVKSLISLSCPAGTDENTINEVLSVFKNHYKGNMENKTRPYDGIVEMLEKLKQKGVKTAVLSNKFDEATKRLCANLLGDLIMFPVGEREGCPRKPSPLGVEYILGHFDCSNEKCALVGDSDTDIKTALNANITPIGVTWGYRGKEVLANAGAKIFANTPRELYSLLAD